MVKKIINEKTDKKKIHNLSKTGIIIQHYLKKREEQRKKGIPMISYNYIAKEVGVDKSTVYYYSKCRPNTLYEKNKSKMPQKYIEYIYKKTANKKVTEISGGRLAEQVNEKLERVVF